MSSPSPTPTPAEPRAIEIIVEADGSTSVETYGYIGPSCREASAFIERALGRTTGETLTAAFHQTATQPQLERQSE